MCAPAAAALLIAAPATAQAQFDSGRDGITIGVGFGIGHMMCSDDGCDGFTEAGTVDLHLGSMFSPRLALMLDVWGLGHGDQGFTLTNGFATVGLQGWIIPRLWIKGGVGIARTSLSYDSDFIDIEDKSSTDPGLLVAAGFEVIQILNFAIDVQLRAGSTLFTDESDVTSVGFSIGANFY